MNQLIKYTQDGINLIFNNNAAFLFSMATTAWLGHKMAYSIRGNLPGEKQSEIKRVFKVILVQNALMAIQLSINHLYYKGGMDQKKDLHFHFIAVILETILFSIILDLFRRAIAHILPPPYAYVFCAADYNHNN